MIYRVLAGLVALSHGGFVVFVVAGGLLIQRWPMVTWLHILCAVYGVLIMVFNWRCPITDLEIWLRRRAGQSVTWTEYLHRYLWSHFGLKGDEWFVLAGFVAVLLALNWRPYQALLA